MAAKRYSSDEKVMIVREFIDSGVPISDIADKYNIHPNAIYNWKKSIFESAADSFTNKDKVADKKLAEAQRKINQLQTTLAERESLIAEIVSENIDFKKKVSGESLIKNGSSRM